MPPRPKSLLATVIDLVDGLVEIYLKSIIKPFLSLHEHFYGALNSVLRKLLDDNSHRIPEWFTANFITYARTVLVAPTLVLLSMKHSMLPAILVIAVDVGDFLDGVVARYWVDVRKQREKALAAKTSAESPNASRAVSPAVSDDDSFEIVTTGSPQTVPSWVCLHRNRNYGGFIDAVCDKAYVIPCWISLLHLVPTTGYLRIVQYVTLLSLALCETASGCIRLKAYFISTGVPAPPVQGFDFSSSAVKADHIGKAKQSFEMIGTALYILPVTRYIGLLLLFSAIPLAYESVRRKVQRRVIYVQAPTDGSCTLDHKVLKFWMQVSSMASVLLVGVPKSAKGMDMVMNACAVQAVSKVICDAPGTVDLMFLEKEGIDYVVSVGGQPKFVTDEVVQAGICLVIGEDGIARPLKKAEHAD